MKRYSRDFDILLHHQTLDSPINCSPSLQKKTNYPEERRTAYEDSVDFIYGVKMRDEKIYQSLLASLCLYNKKSIDKDDLCRRVLVMLQNHQDLVAAFIKRFMFAREAAPSPGEDRGLPSLNMGNRRTVAPVAVKKTTTTTTNLCKKPKVVESDPRKELMGVEVIPERVVYANCKSLVEEFTTFTTVPEPSQVAAYRSLYSHTLKNTNSEIEPYQDSIREEKHPGDVKASREEDRNLAKLPKPKASMSVQKKLNGSLTDKKASTFDEMKEQGACFFQKVKEKLSCPKSFTKFLESTYYYSTGKLGEADFESRVEALIGQHPDLVAEFRSHMRSWGRFGEFSVAYKPIEKSQEKHKNMSSHELDRCTPSYQLRPDLEDNPAPPPTDGRTVEGQVLNDRWVCLPPASYSSKHPNKTKKEKMMFKWEDERFELDMQLGWIRSATSYVTDFLEGRKEGEDIAKSAHFTMCIKNLNLFSNASGVLEEFSLHPRGTMPLIVDCLKKKEELVLRKIRLL